MNLRLRAFAFLDSPARESSRRALSVEKLETRDMFAVNVLITEVMASNGTTIADGDGQYSDWIEIYNPTSSPINLAGWHLTDDEDELAKWTFPAAAQSVLDPGEYLIVFASGQLTSNYIDPAGYLHTNFALSSDGEYLALTNTVSTVVSEFSPQFPSQRRDVSFGLVDNATTVPLIGPSSTAKALVPTNGSLDSANPATPPAWTLPGFNDASWSTSVGGPGVGFDLGDTPPPNIPNGVVLPEGLVGGDYTDPDENGVFDGTIFAGGFPGSPANEEPPKALDNSPDSKWLAFIPEGTYYGFRFSNGTKRVVDSYTITSANDAPERDPYSWTLSGSNDGVNYTVVDSRTAQTFGSRYETRLYQFTNTTAYEYYKFDIKTRFGATGQGSTNSVQVAEFELLSSAGVDFTPLVNLNVAAAYTPVKTSVYQRIKFNVANPAALATLRLEMQYDDGFVAYLNGKRVASASAPASVNYQSNATAERTDGESLVPTTFNLTPYLADLVAGDNVLSIHILNRADSSPDLLSRPQLIATQLIDDTKLQRYMTQPTPGTPNVDGYEGIVATPQFSVGRGFYDAPFQLSIANPTAGSQLYYTTNGDAPTPATGILYTGPISVTGTTTVRAQSFRAGYLNSTPVTSTYLFVNDIIRQNTQSTLNSGFPATWGGVTPDYGMDRDVIGNFNSAGVATGGDLYGGVYAATIKNDLKAIPTLSLVMDIDDMFGSAGIYSNPTAGGSAWERPVSAELIYPDGSPGFQIDAGIRIQGGAFRSPSLSAKHSMRLLFKGIYEGNTKLEFPLFGEENATSFDTLTLRMDSNDGYAWASAGPQAQYARDEFGRRSQEALGQATPHGNRVHLYINGVYWGIYNPVERPDASFSASYYGGEKEDWDAINSGAVVDGDMTAWNTLLSLSQAVASSGTEAARTAAYMKVLGLNPDGTDNAGFETYLDATNYVDYLMVNFLMGNNDWPHRNWWASRMHGPDSQGFVFHIWDAETTMGLGSDINTNRLGVSDLVAAPYSALKSSLEFRVLFSDRVHRAFFNNGALSTQANTARYQEIISELSQAIVAESARWGDMHNGTPYTKAQWQSEATNVLNYLNSRNNIFLTQLRNAGLYSSVTAPVFNKFGGLVTPGFDLTMSAPVGATWYTLDGSDPRAIGGGFSPTALYYTGTPVDITAGVTVRARTISGGVWSAINEATFTVAAPASGSNLRISEFHYNPATQPGVADAQTLEFIELFNPSNAPVSLDGVSISQFITEPYVFPSGLLIEAGQRLVVARNPSILLATYGSSINVASAGYAEGNLSNSGERIVLAGPGGVIQDFTFDDSGDWPLAADGGGKSLEIINVFGDPSSGLNWRASFYRGGSPGTSGVAPAIAGDFNSDGIVDGRDFLAWQRGFGKVALTASANDGDADGDRDVDGSDLTLWKSNFGAAPVVTYMAASSTTSTASVASEFVMALSVPVTSKANSEANFSGVAQRAEQLRNGEKEPRPSSVFKRERAVYALADGSLRPTPAAAWHPLGYRDASRSTASASLDGTDATDCAFGDLAESELGADVPQGLASAW